MIEDTQTWLISLQGKEDSWKASLDWCNSAKNVMWVTNQLYLMPILQDEIHTGTTIKPRTYG